jgi:hypothetical protein
VGIGGSDGRSDGGWRLPTEVELGVRLSRGDDDGVLGRRQHQARSGSLQRRGPDRKGKRPPSPDTPASRRQLGAQRVLFLRHAR